MENIIYKARKSYAHLIMVSLMLIVFNCLSYSFSKNMNVNFIHYVQIIISSLGVCYIFILYNRKLFITNKGLMATSLTKKVVIDFGNHDEYILSKPKDRIFGSVDFVFEDTYNKIFVPFVLEKDFIENLKNIHENKIKITVKNKEYY